MHKNYFLLGKRNIDTIEYREKCAKPEKEIIVRKWALGVKVGRNNNPTLI